MKGPPKVTLSKCQSPGLSTACTSRAVAVRCSPNIWYKPVGPTELACPSHCSPPATFCESESQRETLMELMALSRISYSTTGQSFTVRASQDLRWGLN